MLLYTNGFWPGFNSQTDGVHVGFFISILTDVFNTDIQLTEDLQYADILLETHFGESVFFRKAWDYSIFFSGEGSIALPAHNDKYTWVMGAHTTLTNYVSCPLYLVYDFCKPFVYPAHPTIVPVKSVCSIISSPVDHKPRSILLELLKSRGISVDNAGRRGNTIGYSIPGQYYEQPILDFYKQYKLVCAFENTIMDGYITEKIINVFRAGSIPIYLGSNKISQYFNPDRYIFVDLDHPEKAIAEIQHLLTDESAWINKVNQPIFKWNPEDIIKNIILTMKNYPGLKSK
jgi:hypothetical protein